MSGNFNYFKSYLTISKQLSPTSHASLHFWLRSYSNIKQKSWTCERQKLMRMILFKNGLILLPVFTAGSSTEHMTLNPDASNNHVECVLLQEEAQIRTKPYRYYFRLLSKTEISYNTIKPEKLATILAFHMLYPTSRNKWVLVRIGHEILKCIFRWTNNTWRFNRCHLGLSKSRFDGVYRAVIKTQPANALKRSQMTEKDYLHLEDSLLHLTIDVLNQDLHGVCLLIARSVGPILLRETAQDLTWYSSGNRGADNQLSAWKLAQSCIYLYWPALFKSTYWFPVTFCTKVHSRWIFNIVVCKLRCAHSLYQARLHQAAG